MQDVSVLRNISLLWADVPENLSHLASFKPPSNWNPAPSTVVSLERYLVALDCKFASPLGVVSGHEPHRNWEEKILRTLEGDNSIIIKKADKGDIIVIMNRADCISEATSPRHLSNMATYEVLSLRSTCCQCKTSPY